MLSRAARAIATAIGASSKLVGSLTPEGNRLFTELVARIQAAEPLDRNVLLHSALRAIPPPKPPR
jgi:hypothetical protein